MKELIVGFLLLGLLFGLFYLIGSILIKKFDDVEDCLPGRFMVGFLAVLFTLIISATSLGLGWLFFEMLNKL